MLYNEGFTAKSIGKQLGCSESTVYKKLYEFNMPMRYRYSEISDNDLKQKITEINIDHPNAGQTVRILLIFYSKIWRDKIKFPKLFIDFYLTVFH